MNAQSNDEIQKIIVAVFELTGCKMSADDPGIAMMLLQQRAIDELMRQHESGLKSFLDALDHKSNAVISAADTLKEQKQVILSEILQANSKEFTQAESRLFVQISKRSQDQFDQMSVNLFRDLKTQAIRWGMVMLAVQAGVLLLSQFI